MEIVILVSVLCTLGVVGIVAAIVVAFNKLNKKVEDRTSDSNHQLERVYEFIKIENSDLMESIGSDNRDIHNVIREKNRELVERFQSLYRDYDMYRSEVDKRLDECFSFVDSRCDKLDSKLCKCLPNVKQLLTD
jgi:hypothetical protein|tara:strand:+ start:202 stop:603 length:402 start_codon:yes stop_codon:yes gene_type:complete